MAERRGIAGGHGTSTTSSSTAGSSTAGSTAAAAAAPTACRSAHARLPRHARRLHAVRCARARGRRPWCRRRVHLLPLAADRHVRLLQPRAGDDPADRLDRCGPRERRAGAIAHAHACCAAAGRRAAGRRPIGPHRFSVRSSASGTPARRRVRRCFPALGAHRRWPNGSAPSRARTVSTAGSSTSSAAWHASWCSTSSRFSVRAAACRAAGGPRRAPAGAGRPMGGRGWHRYGVPIATIG